MSITISIEDGMDHAKANGLVSKTYDPCGCGGDVDCSECKGTDQVGFDHYPFEVNMANGNYWTLWSSLGLTPDYCGAIEPKELLDAIASCHPELAVRATTETRGKGGATMIDFGISVDYVAHRLNQIQDIATEAARRGKKVVWG